MRNGDPSDIISTKRWFYEQLYHLLTWQWIKWEDSLKNIFAWDLDKRK